MAEDWSFEHRGPVWFLDEPVRIVEEESAYSISTWRNLMVSCWFGQPTMRPLQIIEATAQKLLEHQPEGILVLGVMKFGVPVAGSEERQLAASSLMRLGKHVIAVASVIEGNGFWAAAIRSTMSLIGLTARSSVKIFGTVPEASEFLSPKLSAPRTGSGAIADLVTTLRKRHQQKFG